MRAMDATQTKERVSFPLSCAVHRWFSVRPNSVHRFPASPAEREDAMKNGIPCNDWYRTVKARKNRINFQFVTDDGNTPSSCTVRIGDTDPKTGEQITDLTFFHEYYRLVDHQLYTNTKEYKNTVSYDIYTNDEGESNMERKLQFTVSIDDPFGENEPEEILRLREIAASLTGRLADIYEALLVKYAGGKEKISMTDLSRKWGVSVTQICKDRDKIIRMIKEKMKS